MTSKSPKVQKEKRAVFSSISIDTFKQAWYALFKGPSNYRAKIIEIKDKDERTT